MSEHQILNHLVPNSNNVNKKLYYRERQLRVNELIECGHETDQATLIANIEYPILKAGDELRFVV